MLFLPHSSYRCWRQMFSSCWEALDCSWKSLTSSLCQSQLHEMRHTPHSPSPHSGISSPRALDSELQQPKWPHPVIFALSPSFLGLHKLVPTCKWRNAGVGSIAPRTRSATRGEWHKCHKGMTWVCVTGGGNKSWLGPQQTLALWHPTGDLVTLVVPTRQEHSSCVCLPLTVAGALFKGLTSGTQVQKSKPELAALQGFILLLSQLCQLELVIKEELQKWYCKRWRDWERHVLHKQELQSCGRTSLTFAMWEKTSCGLLQHSLTLPQPSGNAQGLPKQLAQG